MPENRRQRARPLLVALSCVFACAGAVFVSAQEAEPPPAQIVQRADVPLPPGVDAGVLPPEPGTEAASRLRTSLDAALADVEPAVFSEDESADPATVLPPLAERALEQAQRLTEEGAHFGATDALRGAERLAPDHPGVVRALGLAYVRGGNSVRGLPYLRRAAGMDPGDTDVRIVLARLALDRQEWGEVLALAASIDQANALADTPEPAAHQFAVYLRAVSLDHADYLQSAAELYEQFLTATAPDNTTSAAGREVYILRERSSDILQRIGDHRLALGDPAAALAAYEQADPASASVPGALAARLAYAYLVTGQPDNAQAAVVTFLASPTATEHDAELVAYLAEQGRDPAALDARLAAAQEESRGRFALVAARAAVLPQARTVELIAAWLADQPARLVSFRRAIALLRGAGDSQDDPIALAQALLLTAGEMQRQPQRAQDYSSAFVDLDIDPVALIRALQRPEVAGTDQPMLLRLMTSAYATVDRGIDAHAALSRALALEPDDTVSQRAMIRVLTDLGWRDPAYFEQAQQRLGEVAPDAPWDDFYAQVDLLRNRAFALPATEEQQRARLLRDANRLVTARVRSGENGLDVLLLAARVRAESRGLREGIQAIEQLLIQYPDNERVYTAAIGLYSTIRQDAQRDNNLRLYFDFQDRVRPKLAEFLPESRTARYEAAIALAFESRRPDLALPILETLVEEDPTDARALGGLRYAYEHVGDQADADATELRILDLDKPGVRQSVDRMRFYLLRGDKNRATVIGERTLALEAEGVLPGPVLTGDAASSLLAVLTTAAGDQATEPVYLDMLRRFPDNARLNNALGYRWAMEGRELASALVMLQRALEEGGEVSSYLDSMGWVLYKMGRFAEAEVYLRQALTAHEQEKLAAPRRAAEDGDSAKAIYYDHLGDILYRQGETAAAARHWGIARIQTISEAQALMDDEAATVRARALSKETEARAGREPAVADAPGEAAFGDGGHPADRE